mgnify:CR=1 FL=1
MAEAMARSSPAGPQLTTVTVSAAAISGTYDGSDGNGQLRIEVVRPIDLETRHREEFLRAETRDRNTVELRLDQIIKAEAL